MIAVRKYAGRRTTAVVTYAIVNYNFYYFVYIIENQ